MNNIVYCSFSGGLDSTTMISYFLSQKREVRPVFFYYGSKHNDYELRSAKQVIAHFFNGDSTKLQIIDLRPAFSSTDSALLEKDVRPIPEKSYNMDGSLAATVVPGRNMIMAAVLASMAETEARKLHRQIDIALAVHAGDHALYSDCRADFIESLRKSICVGTEYRVSLEAPFLYYDKAEIVVLAHKIDAPLHLTRSCYKMQEVSCGRCGTCRERLDAFMKYGLQDPIPYAPFEID